MRFVFIAVATVVMSTCAHAPLPPAPDAPATRPPDQERHYTVWLGGARVGTVIEHERWSPAGVVLERTETMRFLRGDSPVVLITTIKVVADNALVPSRVEWNELSTTHRRAIATRDADGWHIEGSGHARDMMGPAGRGDAARGDARDGSRGDPRGGVAGRGDAIRGDSRRNVAPTEVTSSRSDGGRIDAPTEVSSRRNVAPTEVSSRRADPADAIPAELAPLLTRRDGRFAGRVFLIARSFMSGDGRIEPAAPGRLVARLAFDGGAVAEATIDVDGDGSYERIVDGEGVIARRVTATQATEPFEPVDLIAATSIAIGGRGSHLVIDGDIALPPVPGQAAHPVTDGIELALSPKLPGAMPDDEIGPDRSNEIRSIVMAVRTSIVPTLGAGPTTAKQAASATAGDCTTFALAYAAHAAKRAIPTRVVTGLRVDGDRLIRHRWAVSWTGSAWIAVDAAFGAAPAGGDLIGLAVHDADDAGLVAGEAALTMVHSAMRH